MQSLRQETLLMDIRDEPAQLRERLLERGVHKPQQMMVCGCPTCARCETHGRRKDGITKAYIREVDEDNTMLRVNV
jgi:hypothetical protein